MRGAGHTENFSALPSLDMCRAADILSSFSATPASLSPALQSLSDLLCSTVGNDPKLLNATLLSSRRYERHAATVNHLCTTHNKMTSALRELHQFFIEYMRDLDKVEPKAYYNIVNHFRAIGEMCNVASVSASLIKIRNRLRAIGRVHR